MKKSNNELQFMFSEIRENIFDLNKFISTNTRFEKQHTIKFKENTFFTANELDLSKFTKHIELKSQYTQKIKKKISLFDSIKETNYKTLNSKFSNYTSINKKLIKENCLVTYVIDITFTRTNTFLHVMGYSGNLKFFCNSGSLKYKGKSKKSHFAVFRDFYRILVSKLKFLKNEPIALHLKNVGPAKFWIVKKLKKKFFIRVVRSFQAYPYNGCRKRKMRRKKFKKKVRIAV